MLLLIAVSNYHLLLLLLLTFGSGLSGSYGFSSSSGKLGSLPVTSSTTLSSYSVRSAGFALVSICSSTWVSGSVTFTPA